MVTTCGIYVIMVWILLTSNLPSISIWLAVWISLINSCGLSILIILTSDWEQKVRDVRKSVK